MWVLLSRFFPTVGARVLGMLGMYQAVQVGSAVVRNGTFHGLPGGTYGGGDAAAPTIDSFAARLGKAVIVVVCGAAALGAVAVTVHRQLGRRGGR